MKKIVMLAMLLCVVTAFGFAQESYAKDGMLLEPGSINANIGLGFGYGYGIGIGGGVEFAIGKFTIAQKLPFTYGAAGRLGLYLGSDISLAAGAFGTVHFCWGALNLPSQLAWIGNFDSYLGLGLTILPNIGINMIGGTNYFISNNLAINVETGIKSSYIGVLFKF